MFLKITPIFLVFFLIATCVEGKSSEISGIEDSSSEEIGSNKSGSDKSGSASSETKNRCGSKEISSKEASSKEASSKESGSKESGSKNDDTDDCSVEIVKDLDYYRNIWENGIRNSVVYVRPTRYAEFEGVDLNRCEDYGSYDFVIVGGGSAGAVVASRLSEISKWNVLVLEAGGEVPELARFPSTNFPLYASNYDYGYLTQPQEHTCFGAINNQCAFPRGKSLGGSTTLSYQVVMRGDRNYYDEWAALGNPGWSYNDCLDYFKKFEKVNFNQNLPYRGYNGPFDISYNNPLGEFYNLVMNATSDLGFDYVDYNGRNQIGRSATQVHLRSGRKINTYDAYLKPHLNRANLKIQTRSLVVKINFKNRNAESVKFVNSGKCYTAKAKKEVILTAGAINTPHLLMLSGVGPREELDKFSIEQIINLPVGLNMQSQIAVIELSLRNNFPINIPTFTEALESYLNGYGPLTYTPVLQSLLFNISSTGNPDFHISFLQSSPYIDSSSYKIASNYRDVMDEELAVNRDEDIVMNVLYLRPKSRGSVNLNSANPFDFPLFDPKYFTNPEDEEAILNVFMNYVPRLLNTPTFTAYNVTIARIAVTECDDLEDEEYWRCVIRYKSFATNHPTSTCQMGNNRNDSVVNQNLEVHGLSKLKIVDASVMPKIPPAYPLAAVLMIAEKSCDQIKQQYGEL